MFCGLHTFQESIANKSTIEPMYFRARYYDTATGEFLSYDPAGYKDSMSLFRGNFVANGMDPTGKTSILQDDNPLRDNAIVVLYDGGDQNVRNANKDNFKGFADCLRDKCKGTANKARPVDIRSLKPVRLER